MEVDSLVWLEQIVPPTIIYTRQSLFTSERFESARDEHGGTRLHGLSACRREITQSSVIINEPTQLINASTQRMQGSCIGTYMFVRTCTRYWSNADPGAQSSQEAFQIRTINGISTYCFTTNSFCTLQLTYLHEIHIYPPRFHAGRPSSRHGLCRHRPRSPPTRCKLSEAVP